MSFKSHAAVVEGTSTVHKMGTRKTPNEKLWDNLKEGRAFAILEGLTKANLNKLTEAADKKLVERVQTLQTKLSTSQKAVATILRKYKAASKQEEKRIASIRTALNVKKWDDSAAKKLKSSLLTNAPKLPKTLHKELRKFNPLLKQHTTIAAAVTRRATAIKVRREKESKKLVDKAVNEKRNEVKKTRLPVANKRDIVSLLSRINMMDRGARLVEKGNTQAIETGLEIPDLLTDDTFVITNSKKPTLKYGGKLFHLLEDEDSLFIGTADLAELSVQGVKLDGVREKFVGRVTTIKRSSYVVVSAAPGYARYQGVFVCIKESDVRKPNPSVISWKVADLRKALTSLGQRVQRDTLEKAKKAAAAAVVTQEKLQENIKRLTDLGLIEGDKVVVQYTHPRIQREETVVDVDAARGVVVVRAGYGMKGKEVEGRFIIEMT